MSDISNLKPIAATIRDATIEGENTSMRVGTFLIDLVDATDTLIEIIEKQIDDITVTSTCDAIENINEIISFLNGFKQTDQLSELLRIVNDKIDSQKTSITSAIETANKSLQILNKILQELENKVTAVPGKGLSTTDFTEAEKYKLANLETSDIKHGSRPLTFWMSAISDWQDKADDLHNAISQMCNQALDIAKKAAEQVEDIDVFYANVLNGHEDRITDNEASLKSLLFLTANNGWRELVESSFNANNYDRMRCVLVYQLSGKNEYATKNIDIEIATIAEHAASVGMYGFKHHDIIYPNAPDMSINNVLTLTITFDAHLTATFHVDFPSYILIAKYYLQ